MLVTTYWHSQVKMITAYVLFAADVLSSVDSISWHVVISCVIQTLDHNKDIENTGQVKMSTPVLPTQLLNS